jgi:cytochrome c553
MRLLFVVFIASAYVSCGASAGSVDIAAGKHKAFICQNCHGEQGISELELYPNLAGQKQLYLKMQLENFRDGTRPSVVMAPMASSLSDQDIDNLAAYYASLKD